MNLQQTAQEIMNTQIAIKDLIKKHDSELKALMDRETELKRQQKILFDGLDIEKILEAEKILLIGGLENLGIGDTWKKVKHAIEIVSQSGSGKYQAEWGMANFDMFKEFFGCKNYAPWVCQSSDCDYGYGPRHGSIVFKIGLQDEIRKNQTELTDKQIELCLYYLGNIEKVKEAKKAA